MYRNLYGKLKKYFNFSKEEVISILIATIFFSFMLSFRNWGSTDTISISYGLYAWLATGCIFFLFYTLYLTIIKCMAIWKGYTMEFKLGKFITVIALLFTFMSEGIFVLLIPGSFYFNVLKSHRLGKLKTMKYSSYGYFGTIAALILIMIASLFAPLYNNGLIYQKLLIIPLMIAIFSMLPIPHITGFYLITVSFVAFSTLTFVVFITALFAYLEAGLIISLLIALFSAVFAWILFYKYLE